MIVFVHFCATWIWFVFLRETWLLTFFCEREAVFRIFRDPWKGQILLHEGVFRRGIGDPLKRLLWKALVRRDFVIRDFEVPLKYRHCNFLLIRFVHFKFCPKIHLFRSSQRGCTYLKLWITSSVVVSRRLNTLLYCR